MKVAIIGSRNLTDIDISEYVPDETKEIISGGANGIDTLAEQYADKHGICKTIIKPEYEKYKRNAPLMRNKEIVEKSDFIVAFWDGQSRGTKHVIDYAKKLKKKIEIYVFSKHNGE